MRKEKVTIQNGTRMNTDNAESCDREQAEAGREFFGLCWTVFVRVLPFSIMIMRVTKQLEQWDAH